MNASGVMQGLDCTQLRYSWQLLQKWIACTEQTLIVDDRVVWEAVAHVTHITATLHDDLHWLRIMYKLCTIVYKYLHVAAPSYPTEMYVSVAASTGRHRLCCQQHVEFWWCPEREHVDHVLLQSPDHVSGMICHWLCVHHPPHLYSSRAD